MTAIEVRCESCGESNPPGARFCSSCGAPLGGTAPPQEERKLVSVLFVDLVDSTARADKADPEDVRDVLQLYHREAKACIEQVCALRAIGSPSALATDYRHCGNHEPCDACVMRRTPDPSAFAT